MLLKYDLSRRLVLTVHIPNLATPAGGSSGRPLCASPPAFAAAAGGATVVAFGGVSGSFVARGIEISSYVFDRGDSGEKSAKQQFSEKVGKDHL